jgi:hypothetical protein
MVEIKEEIIVLILGTTVVVIVEVMTSKISADVIK